MANYLKMPKRQQVIALLTLGWSFRQIERETGVRRETVSRYARAAEANPAKVFAGSAASESAPQAEFEGGPGSNAAKVFAGSTSNAAEVFAGSGAHGRGVAASYATVIRAKLEQGLSIQRVYQDLVEEQGYGHSYESVKRLVRRLPAPVRAVGVLHSAPGEEAQVDFFQGAPTLDAAGQWRRPWVFRMTLSHSRHGYEEAVWDQKQEAFLRLHERAFRDLGGVPKVVRHDNLKAAVVRACLHDPDMNVVYQAFARHWGFVPLAIAPRTPRHNGKQERAGGYVKDNALKGRKFDSLEEHNAHLRHWNRTVARLRIHGTTRRQVYTHYLESDKYALQALAVEPFAYFESASRRVHPDGHVEVGGAFYPVPLRLIGNELRVRIESHCVRIYEDDTLVAFSPRLPAGQYGRRDGQGPAESSTQRAFVRRLLGRCERIGPDCLAWAEQAIEERDVQAIRTIQSVLGLLRQHPKERVVSALKIALANRAFRYKHVRRLIEQAQTRTRQASLTFDDPDIRPMDHYRLEKL